MDNDLRLSNSKLLVVPGPPIRGWAGNYFYGPAPVVKDVVRDDGEHGAGNPSTYFINRVNDAKSE